MTKRMLESKGLRYREINVEEEPSGYEFVTGMGYKSVPVVVIGFKHPTMGGEHWSGFQPDKLNALVG